MKRGVIQLVEKYTRLRYIKFIGLLCNFLGIMGAAKSMRHSSDMEWSVLISVACLGLSIQWLRVINCLIECLKSSMFDIQNRWRFMIIFRWSLKGRASSRTYGKCTDHSSLHLHYFEGKWGLFCWIYNFSCHYHINIMLHHLLIRKHVYFLNLN